MTRGSAGEPAAVDDEVRARDEARPLARQERRGVGDILRSAEARPGRALLLERESRRILRKTAGAGHDLPRRDAVADDEVLGVVDRNLARDVDGPRLAHPIGQVPRTADDALLGAEVDQPPPDLGLWLLADHLLDRALAAVEHAREVDAQHAFPLLRLGLKQGGA